MTNMHFSERIDPVKGNCTTQQSLRTLARICSTTSGRHWPPTRSEATRSISANEAARTLHGAFVGCWRRDRMITNRKDTL
jgi:hypothetical protein